MIVQSFLIALVCFVAIFIWKQWMTISLVQEQLDDSYDYIIGKYLIISTSMCSSNDTSGVMK